MVDRRGDDVVDQPDVAQAHGEGAFEVGAKFAGD